MIFNLQKNKNGTLQDEAIAWIVGLITISLALFLSFNSVYEATDDIKKSAPKLTYKFPSTYIHTFLLTKVSSEDALKINEKKDKTY